MQIYAATPADAPTIAVMVGELLQEIMQAIGEQAFNFDLPATTTRLQAFLHDGHYHAFVATDESGTAAGFLTPYQSCTPKAASARFSNCMYALLTARTAQANNCWQPPAHSAQAKAGHAWK